YLRAGQSWEGETAYAVHGRRYLNPSSQCARLRELNLLESAQVRQCTPADDKYNRRPHRKDPYLPEIRYWRERIAQGDGHEQAPGAPYSMEAPYLRCHDQALYCACQPHLIPCATPLDEAHQNWHQRKQHHAKPDEQ